ncbi:MAG TPA: cobalamin-independent methionine synthase II family protein [Puia sp.]|nr:cobalamin-independent methionine synthase II family protein [Puia sp.]
MQILTEPIGSIPRPLELVEGLKAFSSGDIQAAELEILFERALKDTLQRFEASGSPVITDGEQTKPSFATYPLAGSTQLDPNGIVIPIADGHTRQLPKLNGGPFHYQVYAGDFYKRAALMTRLPVKQAVISGSALSLLYPAEGLVDYGREAFLNDLYAEHEKDIRSGLDAGAHTVQIDFTEARLALKLDPSRALLRSFIDLNNTVLNRLTPAERQRVGVHSCPGGDHDSTHSADIPYSELLPLLFELNVTNFYLQYAGEYNKRQVLEVIKENLRPGTRVFIGVTDVLSPRIETPQEICDLILEAVQYIPPAQLGTTDDCGFSPFADDTSTSRDIAFEKIRARIEGTRMAEKALGKMQIAL